MLRKIGFIISFIVVVSLALQYSCSSSKKRTETITIFAAASLTNALPAAIDMLQDSLQGADIRYNFASSSILARQILAGSPADIFFSADTGWIEPLAQRGWLDRDKAIRLLANTLVVVAPKSSTLRLHSLQDLTQPGVRFIAMGDPAHVPAGRYARQALMAAGIWPRLSSKLVSGQDVRAALSYVESGEADAGLVYASDVKVSHRVKLMFALPPRWQPKIRYVVAPLKNASPLAEKILRGLQSQRCGQVFRKYGFTFLPRASGAKASSRTP